MVVSAKVIVVPVTGDKAVEIRILGASANVIIKVTSPDGEEFDPLNITITSAGEAQVTWTIPEESVPGTYTIEVSDGNESAEATFVLESDT